MSYIATEQGLKYYHNITVFSSNHLCHKSYGIHQNITIHHLRADQSLYFASNLLLTVVYIRINPFS